MSRRIQNGEQATWRNEWTPEEALAIQQSLDMQLIQQVKEILCTLWKQNRITIEVRAEGESALSAALHAVENPTVRGIPLSDGRRLSNAQWQRQNEENSREF